MIDLGQEHRKALAARARAELLLNEVKLRGRPIEWSGKGYFYEGWPILRVEGPMDLGRNPLLRGGPVRVRLHSWPTGKIEFGLEVGMNFGSEISAAVSVKIGDYARLAPYVTIYDTNFHRVNEGGETKMAPVVIGRNVWIGRSALILPGATIGDHSVVASFSVVTGDVPDRTIVAGNPAKPVGKVKASDDWRRT